MQTTKLHRSKQAATGAPIFKPEDVERFARFIHNSNNDTVPEFFNRCLKTTVNLVRSKYRRGLISKARAIDDVMCLLACANRQNGYCYGLLKLELRKERAR